LNSEKETVGIIGSGSFGITIAKLLHKNVNVILYSRSLKTIDELNAYHDHFKPQLPQSIQISSDPQYLCENCRTIFPVVPSSNFREMMKTFSKFLNPSHVLIHATKGFDYRYKAAGALNNLNKVSRDQVSTMSEVIKEESTVLRVGCMAGPNLAKEIIANKPAATVIASDFEEVIQIGIKLLSSDQFFVFGSSDIRGAEIAGAYKNIIALGSGLLGGLDIGKNAQAIIITRGLHEMILFGKRFGTEGKAFLGTAGIGDLVATATSQNSRNYSFGEKIARGQSLEEVIASSKEVVEGIRTLKIVKNLASSYNLQLPITNMLYSIIYEGYDLKKAINLLMKYPFKKDVEFI